MDETPKDTSKDQSEDEVSGYRDPIDTIGQMLPPLPGTDTYPPTPVDDTGTGDTLSEMPPPQNTVGSGGGGPGGTGG